MTAITKEQFLGIQAKKQSLLTALLEVQAEEEKAIFQIERSARPVLARLTAGQLNLDHKNVAILETPSGTVQNAIWLANTEYWLVYHLNRVGESGMFIDELLESVPGWDIEHTSDGAVCTLVSRINLHKFKKNKFPFRIERKTCEVEVNRRFLKKTIFRLCCLEPQS